jgi:TolA-binding protein
VIGRGEPKLPSAPTAEPSASATAVVAERRWRDALANGEWDEILADAERDGIDRTLQTAPSDDLFALADAARYRRRTDLARTTLLTHRRRFPSSPRSLDAIFLLGRVEELRAGGRAPAIEWYDEYLSRAPTGTYAAEALGRKMVLTKELVGPESARAIAEEYLRRFPQGSYAGAARALERAP